ncbi:MAG TPA: glycoside hydrolase family 38 C-terminal domain-containing protein, partial [Thermomicrobiales bacterium]|nr:glycoside hydrolase family 38 C-terminal domain-containing protein [Thermomicrobiales bacterium]
EQSALLIDAGLHRLAAAYSPAKEAIASFLVFNPVGFERDALVRAFLPSERAPLDASFRLVDAATGAELPYALEPQPHPQYRASGQWVNFVAPALPSLGYARIDVVAGQPDAFESSNLEPYRLQSPFYEVAIDPSAGFITSIVDRETGRELVDTGAAHGFNEYIYDRYTSAPGFNHLSGRVEALDFSLLGERSTAGFASVIARESNAVVDRIVLRLVAPGAEWLETTITLPRQTKQVLIENRLLKRGIAEKESVYFAFPFAVDDPDPEYAITGGVTSLDAPHVPGSVQHMLAIRDWVGLQDEQGSAAWVTVDAPLIELQNIAVPYAPFPNSIPGEHHRRATIYSWALNNIWDTNFPPQQRGEMVFRYAIGSSADTDRRTLGIETAAAVVSSPAALCLRASDAPELAARTSLLSVSDPRVEIIHLEPGSTDDGLRALLLSQAPEPVTVEVAAPGMRLSAIGTFLGTHMEPTTASTVHLHPGDYTLIELQRS